MNTPQDVADRIIKVARKHDTDVQEAIVTNLGLESSGLIQVQLKDSPIHVRATGVEQLAVGDAVFVKRLTGDQWSIWHYAGFSHRGDVTPSSPFYWVPRVPQIMDNGILLPTRKITNFIGATVVDNPTLRSTDITLSGGGTSTLALGAMAWSDTNQNISPNTHTALVFQHADWDTNTCFSLSAPTVLTCHTAGVYAATAYAQLVVSTPGTVFNLELIVEKNTPLAGGWTEIARNSVGLPPVDNPACTVTAPPRTFLIGDQVRVRLNHSSTVTEHTAVSTYATGTKPAEPPQLALWKIGNTTSSIVSALGAQVFYNSFTIQTLPNDGDTTITFDTALYDDAGFWSASAPTRLTVPVGQAGRYLVGGMLSYLNSANGTRSTFIRVNGSGRRIAINLTTGTGTSYTTHTPVGPANLADGDYIELHANQTSGGNLDVGILGFNETPNLWLQKVV